MKKYIVLVVLVLPLVVAIATADAATYESVFSFEGFYKYSGDPDDIDPWFDIDDFNNGYGFDFDSSGLQPTSASDYYGDAGVAYELDLNLPDPLEPCNWSVEYSIMADGQEVEWDGQEYAFSIIDVDDSDSFDLGVYAVGITEQDVAGAVSNIPEDFYVTSVDDTLDDLVAAGLPLTSEQLALLHDEIPDNWGNMQFHFEGDETAGTVLGAIDANIFDNDPQEYEWAVFSGDITLTAECQECPGAPVPEPATMLLFGSGLIGFIFRRMF